MKQKEKKTLYACYLGYVTQAIVNNLAALLFLTFQRQLSISLEQISFLVALNFGVQMLTDLLAAKYADRIGYRIAVVSAHIFCTAGLICMGILPMLLPFPYVGLIIAIVINAIGGGLIEVVVSPIVEALPTKEKSSSMSLLHSFYCWGQAAVVLLSTVYFVTAGLEHWYYLPVIWAVLPLVNAVIFTKTPLYPLVEEEHRTPLNELLKHKMIGMMLLLMLCAGAAELSMSQWASLFAEAGLQVPKTIGDLLGPCAFALLMGLSRLFYGKRGTKIDLQKFLLISSLLCVASYLLCALSPLPILSLLGCALCGLFVGIMWPGTLSLSARYFPRGGTAMFAFLALAGDVGCAAGPGLVGIVSDWAQRTLTVSGQGLTEGAALKIGLLCAAIFPLIMLIGAFILKRTAGKRTQEAPAE